MSSYFLLKQQENSRSVEPTRRFLKSRGSLFKFFEVRCQRIYLLFYLSPTYDEKTGRYLRPTAVVQEILPDIKVILDAYSSLEKFKFKEKELIGTLKVGFNDALVNDKLAAVFQKFKKNRTQRHFARRKCLHGLRTQG